MVKHFHCPVNGWDCPYYTDTPQPCMCTLEDPFHDFASMWDEDDDYADYDLEVKQMEIKCPYCGSEEYECYDRCGDGTMRPIDLCVCEECEKQFSIIFEAVEIIKESGE